ncbi:MAG: putative rane-bound dehydrogenase [Verrucomicrobiales bacterium]|nr:putative rane-bound dehydrogenase [Verrucomicrobiales bacterium]
MKRLVWLVAFWLGLSTFLAYSRAAESKPLRVFLRAGEKTHGPGQHDHPKFLQDWSELLKQRGATVEGAMNFPNAEQLERTDVLILFAAEAGTIERDQRSNLEKFLKRGGGIIAIHDAVCGKDPEWFKTIIGGAWEHGHSKWFEGDIAMYFQDVDHPITKEVSNFDFDDEIYYDLHMMPSAKILAASYAPDKRNTRAGRVLPSVYDIVPQIWTYQNTLKDGEAYRAFVSIPGHNYKSFNLPFYRALLLRGIAWAAKREIDSLLTKEELQSLRYPAGGPTEPNKAAALIKTLPDFNISLVAAEPLINKPISLDWDAKGRLWVAETPEYPAGRHITKLGTTATWTEKSHTQSDGEMESRPARDRISILEDSNHDGVMDKKSVFFDGLELVTSFVFHKDGVIVAQAPDIYWLRDTNHDDKADEKITLYAGFGTRDTHAVISNMRWGMDGWIYMTLGYSGGSIKSGDGKKDFGSFGSGVLRFKPDGSAMEQVSSKGGNTWGVDIAPDGEIFYSQANGNHINHVVMPESALARGKIGNTTSFKTIEDHDRSFPIRDYDKQPYVQIDVVGGFTAASGACIYNGGAWPEKYNNTFFVTEPTVNLVHQDFLKQNGVTYTASRDPERPDKEFVASTDLWFRPVHTRVGPDGALYILDFYNQAVVHNDTRGPKHGPNNAAIRPDRDHYFGRIWRVQHNAAKKFELPKLEGTVPAELVKALRHPNGWVRMTAERLLIEEFPTAQDIFVSGSPLILHTEFKRLLSSNPSVETRIAALWTLDQLGLLTVGTSGPDTHPELNSGVSWSANDADARVRKTSMKVAADGFHTAQVPEEALRLAHDNDARVQLDALLYIAAYDLSKEPAVVNDLSSLYPSLNNQWSESAFAQVAARAPLQFIETAFNSTSPLPFKNLVGELSAQLACRTDYSVRTLLKMISTKSSSTDVLKRVVLESVGKSFNEKVEIIQYPDLQEALRTLLTSKDPSVAAATLPVISRLDKAGKMSNDVKTFAAELSTKLNDEKETDEHRAAIVASLMTVRHLDAGILPSVAKILGSSSSPALQKKVIEAVGSTGDPAVGSIFAEAYAKLPADLQASVFDQMIKRPDWSLALVDAVKSGKVKLATLGPNAVHRLRGHPDKNVSTRANEVIDAIRGPETKEKDALIAKFTPLVTQAGNVENGHKQFVQNCAVCHKFNGEGKEVAPDLTGMGAHGPAELLVHVLDPNRVVEPNFSSYSIETKSGDSYDGIVATETKGRVVLRNASGDNEIPRKEIVSMKNTGRSLMPEGFEALGAETLRDILTYICAAESKYRILDLAQAYTVDSGRGIYSSLESTAETLSFKKFGLVKVGDIPFEIANPQKINTGKNLIVLRGGSGFAKTLPQQVEITNLNLKATQLYFLGGVGGWAWPFGGDANKDLPAAKIIVHYADKQIEEFILKNGVDLVDYVGRDEVPGSKMADGLVDRGQVRYFSKLLKNRGTIQRISIESFDNVVAPTFVSITAEVAN